MEEENHGNEEIEQIDVIKTILSAGNPEEIKQALEDYPTATVAEYLLTLEYPDIVNLLKNIEAEDVGRILSDFTIDQIKEVFYLSKKSDFSDYFSHMYSVTRADFYQELEKEEQIELLPYLDKKTREDVILLSAYPPETAGGIMNTDFATILSTMTCAQALAKIRKDAPSQKMIYYLYVVDEDMHLLGMISIKDLIMSDPKDLVEDHYTEHIIYSNVNDDREEVARQIEKFDLVAIPVVNSLNQLVGIVSYEEAIDVLVAEQTEDMEKFMGIVPSEDEETYLGISTFQHFKKRVVWIVCLAAIGLISGVIVHTYQGVLEQLIVLALYMPMMAATGGNSGSQAATVVIRAMALDEIDHTNWFKVLFKETKISFLLSLCVGGLVFLKIAFLSSTNIIPNNLSLTYVGFVIGLAISLQVITSAMVGAGLPIAVKRMGGDPAVAASPAITTIVDITGLLIYFAIASYAIGI
jgi:magnesium transporter